MPPKRKNTAPATKKKESKKTKVDEVETEDPISKEETEKPNSEENNAMNGTKQVAKLFASWNVNGIRAWLKKDGLNYLRKKEPDFMLVQETKCGLEEMPNEVKNCKGYHSYFQSTGDRKGYAGVGLFSKQKPIKVDFGMGIEKHDAEGRLITAEYENFYLIGAYVPNSGRGLPRLGYRQEWDADFLAYIKKLDALKPVIYCGDLNVAHKEIDLTNPKSNAKNAGFTKEEREGFTKLLDAGFTDSFRHLYPKKEKAYSFWAYFGNARAKDVGWRLDYFVVSNRLVEKIKECGIDSEIMGSDHCPVTLEITI